jgi:hypothetical protein
MFGLENPPKIPKEAVLLTPAALKYNYKRGTSKAVTIGNTMKIGAF